MTLDEFKKIFHKIPQNLTQIAFGIGDIDGNPELFDMFKYCRENSYNLVIPNVTINGKNISKEHYDNLSKLCGAVAVSMYDKDNCYNSVFELTSRGLKQVNIHMLLSEETYDDCFQVINDKLTDKRLEKLNAIVFLMLKPKGDRNTYNSIKSIEKYSKLVNYAIEKNVQIGMDSCSGPSVLKSLNNIDTRSIEPCESGLFSLYINAFGEAFPCSFTEGTKGWKKGINILQIEDFISDVWNSNKILKWRKTLLGSTKNCDCKFKNDCRSCPVYDISLCKGKKQ
jgi:MoaA/NifB/PqqE/SkfB family radical SAM enzyme